MTEDYAPWHAAGVNPPPQLGDPMKREPVLTVASITSLVAAVLTLLVAFGLRLTGDQQTAILGVAAIAAPIVVAAISRPRVTPVEPVAPGEVGQTNVIGAVIGVLLIVLLVLLVLRLA